MHGACLGVQFSKNIASIRRAFFRSASSKNAARTSIRISGNRYRPVFIPSYLFPESDPKNLNCSFKCILGNTNIFDQVPFASCTVRAQPAFDFADKADLGIARLYPFGMSLGPFCAHPSPHRFHDSLRDCDIIFFVPSSG